MTQNTTSTLQSMMGGKAGFFLSALKSGLDTEGIQGKMFADLLSQISSLRQQDTQANADDGADQTQTANTDNSTLGASSNSVLEDRAALQALMQRIRKDAKALYQNRQQIKRLDKKDRTNDTSCQKTKPDDTSAKTATNDEDDTCTAMTNVVKNDPDIKQTTADDTTSVSGTTTTGEAAQDSAENTGVGMEEILAALSLQGSNTGKTTDTADTDKKTDTGAANDASTKNIIDDLIQAEQAALLLLNKMISDKVATEKNALTGNQTKQETGVNLAPGTTTTENAQTTAANTQTTAANAITPLNAWLRPQTIHKTKPEMQTLPVEMDNTVDEKTLFNDLGQDIAASLVAGKSANQEKTGDLTSSKDEKFEFLNIFGTAATAPSGKSTDAESFIETGANTTATDMEASGNPTTQAATTANLEGNPQLVLGEGTKPAGSYDFASQLSAARATKGGATGLPNPVEQVALQLHKEVKDGNNQITIQLRPPELGRVEVKLSFTQDNKVQGTVVADNQAALDLLSKDVGSLQRALQDAGLRADPGCLQFSLRGDGQGNLFNANANNNGSSGSSPQNYGLTGAETADATDDAASEIYYLTPGRVNLRV